MSGEQWTVLAEQGWALAVVLSVLILSLAWAARGRRSLETNSLLTKILETLTEMKERGEPGKEPDNRGNRGQDQTAGDLLTTWFDSELKLWETNHNHKEAMAWAATALYVPGITVFGWVAALNEVRWRALLVLAVLFVIAFVFVNMQFERRWIAAEVFNRLQEARRRWILEGHRPDTNDDFVSKTFEQWEKALRIKRRDSWSWLELSQDLERLWGRRLSCIDARKRTEVPSYAILFVATLVAIMELWLVTKPA